MKKLSKDPNVPKRAMTPFMIFAQDNRDEIQKQNPSATFRDVCLMTGVRWKELSETERAPYEKKSEEDKARYLKEKQEYQASHDDEEESKSDASSSEEESKPKKVYSSVTFPSLFLSRHFFFSW